MRLHLIAAVLSAVLCVSGLFFPFTEMLHAETVHYSNHPQDTDGNQKNDTDPIFSDENYTAIVYNNQNGLPTSEANDIAETSDGFIWIGSYSGLVRYDGNTFDRFDSTTGIGNVGSLHVDRRDRLWIGTNDCGIAMYRKDELRFWGEQDGLRSLNINSIAEDSSGTIYAATAAGIYMFDESMNVHSIDDPRIRDMYVEEIRYGKDGLIYGTGNDGTLFTVKNGEVVSCVNPEEYGIKGVTSIFPDPDHPHQLYLGTQGSEFYHVKFEDKLTVNHTYDISPMYAVTTIEEINGRMWIGARNGIGVLSSNSFYYWSDLPLNNGVVSIMTDYSGNLWFTSDRQGVMKIVPNKFTDLFEYYDLPSAVVNSTLINGSELFIGTDSGLYIIRNDEVLSSYPLEHIRSANEESDQQGDLLNMLKGIRIRSIVRDSKGRLWISTWQSWGLLCLDHGTLTIYSELDGLLSDRIRVIHERKDGSILVALSGGINVIENGRVTDSYTTTDGITNPESLTIAESPDGEIVVCTDGSGIYVINDNERALVRRLGIEDGLSSEIIMRIKWDEKRKLFWIITSNSLAYMTADYQVTTIRNFPYSNNFDMYENSSEEMWILSSNGIYVAQVSQLLENREIFPTHYSVDNGLPCIATANSYSTVDENGDLYIAGNTGAAKVNINHSLENPVNLKLGIPFLEVNGELIYPDTNGNFHLSSRVHKLTIYSYIFNYSLVNPDVSYQLEGFDSEPSIVSRSELDPVNYTNLPGGNYRFVMSLLNSRGNPEKTLSARIIIDKALYEHTWFYVVSITAFVFILYYLIHTYVQRKTKQMELNSREAVRKERLNTELKTAVQIQESILPHTFPPFPERHEFDLYASMTPAREVGGDFYDYFLIDDDHLCLFIADVSGKGIPAALFMMLSKVIIERNVSLDKSTAEILETANNVLRSNNQVEMFVTVWLGILQISTGIVKAANAGHEYPAVMSNRLFTLLKDPHGLVLGALKNMKYKEYEFQLNPGDKLFVYTDGVPEATDKFEQMFGTDRMLLTLNKSVDSPPEQILKNMKRSINEFVKDGEQFDDCTMLCLEYKGPATAADQITAANCSAETD